MEPITVMIAEDEKIVLQDLLTIVDWEAEGFRVSTIAVNGKQGLQRFQADRPRLIISDVRMPAMDGLTMVRAIKKIDPGVYVIILSAYEEFEYAHEAIRLGAEDYIVKTEMNAELLSRKLREIRTAFAWRRSSILETTKNRLSYLLSAPHEAESFSQSIGELRSVLTRFDKDENFREMLPFMSQIINAEYTGLGMAEKFSPPDAADIDTLMSWFAEEADMLGTLRDGVSERHISPVVLNAVEYIQRNYGNPELKMSKISRNVGLSPGRLGVLFKKEFDSTVNDYITTVRIEAAKRLLLSGKHKVYEVSELVGYRTSQYFSQIFYLRTGQYPNKYRREV